MEIRGGGGLVLEGLREKNPNLYVIEGPRIPMGMQQ